MYLEDPRAIGFAAVEELLRRGQVGLTNEDRALLGRYADPDGVVPEQDLARLRGWRDALLAGFCDAATDGYEFLDRAIVERKFGTTIAQNYPEANATFLRFANTYWSLKILADELLQEERQLILTAVVSGLERQAGPLFFPFPGPAKIDPARRERDQRAALGRYAPRLDVEAFILGNPILIRDRGASGAGCLAVLLLPVAGAIMKLVAS